MGRRSITAKIYDNASTRKRFSALGIRYHDIEEEDTMESVCNQYGISKSALMQANFGMRSTLSCGHKRIIIPANENKEEMDQDAQAGDVAECKEQEDLRDETSQDVDESVSSHIGLVTVNWELWLIET